MKQIIYLALTILISQSVFSQSLDDDFSKEKMKKDLEIFKDIRIKANSGLYKYRTKAAIDSIYKWADSAIENANSHRDFYNIICQLTDFEGSVHNNTRMPKKYYESLRKETHGYFPLQIKQIENKAIVNIKGKKIPLGSEIISINDELVNSVFKNLYKYYTTDGTNITGKAIGTGSNFAKYYRLNYGLTKNFKISYKIHGENDIKSIVLKSISFSGYANNFKNRYSKPYDNLNYLRSNEFEEKYSYRNINEETGMLTINTFAIGWNKDDDNHKIYVKYLDSIFSDIKVKKIKNLIIDIRHNGGGTDPNDLVTYSYFAQRKFQENKKAWVSFTKIPYMKYIETKVPRFLRFIGVIKYNLYFKQEFPIEKDGKYYQDSSSDDHQVRMPKENAFKGKIYLLISPRIASAGSLFAAMVTGNENTTVIGEETMGGYYGHNGHIPMTYILPKSKLETSFSIVNLEQDVPIKENQIANRGIIPDHKVTQTYDDFINHTDVQMNFTLKLIDSKK